jgi:RNA polymerase sigma-70 factor, ECF subfamily
MEPDGTRREVVTLFDEHGAAVYRFALTLLRHREDAEDVLQETYLKLLAHLQMGRSDANLRGWLFTVAAHACRDRMRRRGRWLPWSPEHDATVGPPALEDEDGRLRAVRAAMQRLSRRDRLLVALRAQGLSYADISRASGIKAASVGRLLARALQRWERAYAAAPPLPHAYGRSSS